MHDVSPTSRGLLGDVVGALMAQAVSSNKHMLRTRDAARYCGMAESTLEKLRITGGGSRFIKLGKSVVYDPADLDDWLEANKRRSTTDRA